ncbi:MAG: Penicillin-binding protein 2 [Candidatus Giovannonibacteria bacterium GW2011_GWA2_53_7]|uniref:Penicillin-binding protein 2 n=1 Tax=Candidatus Giovannonibacteria bacterium GW2011_GWA2_53_7 TaxID=1618650 RepID=A0A0G2AQ83_9BACT|nr:MAG: Penicillin-binding protein 2 [Candidatus Giovannonibacteria bacterium GW2011_GWA2_53_7]
MSLSGGHSLWLVRLVSAKKIRLFLLVLVLVFVVLFSRLFFLQFSKGSYFKGLAEGNRLRLEQVLPSRGIIFDRHGVPLVENVAFFTLFFESSQIKADPGQKEAVRQRLEKIGFEAGAVEEILGRESFLPMPIKENLTYEEALELMIDIKGIEALKIEIDQQRKYQENLGLSHLLGYTSRINPEEKNYYLDLGYQLTEKVGRLGIEEYYQEALRGEPGKKQIEVDSLGREIKVLAEEEAIGGNSLFLSLDAGLQEQVNRTLRKYLPNRAGAIVALDPNSGKVRAFSSWPPFDNNEFSQGISADSYQSLVANPLKPLFDRAIAGEYPSGSTIKLIMGLAGLEEGLIARETIVYSIGGVWYDKWFFPDWKEGGHGLTNIIKAIAESVNTYFYYLALEEFEGRQGLGLEKMLSYFSSFGLGQSLGIDINGEKEGFLPTKKWKEEAKGEIWYPGDTLHLAIGQGDILVTPLQVASFTAAIANGGILYQVQLLEKITESASGQTITIGPEALKRSLGKYSNLEIIKEGMRQAVVSGSARGIYGLAEAAAGKTGTAQVGGNELPHAWFTGFLPYDNPQLVITVLVENGGEGSDMAVPVAREILSWYESNRL